MVLAHYDPQILLKVAEDSSACEVGAVMLHIGKMTVATLQLLQP